jgi:hypothetical protein
MQQSCNILPKLSAMSLDIDLNNIQEIMDLSSTLGLCTSLQVLDITLPVSIVTYLRVKFLLSVYFVKTFSVFLFLIFYVNFICLLTRKEILDQENNCPAFSKIVKISKDHDF